MSLIRSAPARLLWLLTVTAGVTALLKLWPGSPSLAAVALVYLLPVMTGVSLGGLGLGLAAAVLAFFALNFYFIPPLYSFLVHQPEDLVVLGMFLGVAGVFSQLLARAQRSLAAAQARERETTALYELGTALTRQLAPQAQPAERAQVLAEHVRSVTRAAQVRVDYAGQASQPGQSASSPAGAPLPAAAPAADLPLATARGAVGRLRLWRPGTPPTVAEVRLLQAFASQGALAIEHSLLAQAETQARIVAESDRMKSALLSSVSHELRTPLASIKAAANSLPARHVADRGGRP
jgi:two-component system sensor histidine kinase KdpD